MLFTVLLPAACVTGGVVDCVEVPVAAGATETLVGENVVGQPGSVDDSAKEAATQAAESLLFTLTV